MDGTEIVRLITVHPALVHLPIGAAAIVALAYLVAAVRRSERWTFAGDVAVVAGAVTSAAAAAFGLVSFFLVPWPGGLATWRWLHLGLGVATTIVFIAIAAVRLLARRRGRTVSAVPSAVAGVVLGILVLATGWVGGEVLVFDAGIAVEGAALGALAPLGAEEGEPTGMHDAMGSLRGAWASSQVALASMVVEHPSDVRYDEVARAARRMAQLARWVAERGGSHGQGHGAEGHGEEHGGGAEHGHGGEEHGGDEGAPLIAAHAGALERDATALEEAARARSLPDAVRAAGAVTAACADCHLATRWR